MMKFAMSILLAMSFSQGAYAGPAESLEVLVITNPGHTEISMPSSTIVTPATILSEPAPTIAPRDQDRRKARRALLAAMLAMAASCDGGCPVLAIAGN